MVLDKDLQKSIGFDGKAMTAHITMLSDDFTSDKEKRQEPIPIRCNIDVLTAIKT